MKINKYGLLAALLLSIGASLNAQQFRGRPVDAPHQSYAFAGPPTAIRPEQPVAAPSGSGTRLTACPIPASGTVTILNADLTRPLAVFNVLGRLITEVPAGSNRFDTSNWARGMYFVRQGRQMAKLVLE